MLVKLLSFVLSIVVFSVYYALSVMQRKSLWSGPSLPAFEEPENLPDNVIFHRLTSVIGTSHIALYYTKPQKFKPWVVFTHGIQQHAEFGLHLMEKFAPVCNFLSWDYRGFGRSTGEADRLVCNYDLYAILHWLRHEFEVENVTLIGSSLGTNVTLHFLQTFGKCCNFVNRVILFHPFYSLYDVFEHIGAPASLAYILGRMDVSMVLPEWQKSNQEHKALILGSSQDAITPWQKACDICEKCDLEAVECVDVGGPHFEFNEVAIETMKKWIADKCY